MFAIRLHSRAGPGALVHEPAPMPRAGVGEVLVRVEAAAVTPSELHWTPTWTTKAGTPRPFPIIPGHEFAGVVDALGPDVPDFAIGDKIFGMNDWYRDGAQADYCVARAADVALAPTSIDAVHAAATPISALTAWQGLIERAQLAPRERVLVHGGAGGVGLFAVQVAHWRGAHVIATASAQNVGFVHGLGADEVIDYRARPFEDAARNVDVVFDTVGGETLARSWSVLAKSGRMITVATAGDREREPRERDAFFIVTPDREQLERVARWIDAGELRPVVGAMFPLADAVTAYRHKPERGKVVLAVDAMV